MPPRTYNVCVVALGSCENIRVQIVCPDDSLLFLQRERRLQLIAQHRRAFEIQSVGSFLHFLLQKRNKISALAVQKADRFIDICMVLLARDGSVARSAAFTDVIKQTGSFAAALHFVDALFAVSKRIKIINEPQFLLHGRTDDIRTEICSAVLFDASHDFNAREVLP